jgi:hypothetical protein
MAIYGKKIALAIIDTDNHVLAGRALSHSLALFPVDQVIIFSDHAGHWMGYDVIKIPAIRDITDYNLIVTAELAEVLDCDFVLIIQFDGFVLNPAEFAKLFLYYDYIGAPWIHFNEFNVGNGGFSLRSKRLVDEVAKIGGYDPSCPEDLYICRSLRVALESKGIKFAPAEIARHFSVEYPGVPWQTFGFHGLFHLPQLYRAELDYLMSNLSPRIIDQRNPLFVAALESIDSSYLKYFKV